MPPKNPPYVLRVQCPVYVHKGVQLYLSLCSAGTYTKLGPFYLNDSLSQSFCLSLVCSICNIFNHFAYYIGAEITACGSHYGGMIQF